MRTVLILLLGVLLGAVVGAAGMALLGSGRPSIVAAATRGDAPGGAVSTSSVAEPAQVDAAIAAARVERGSSSADVPSELAEGVGDLLRRAPTREVPRGDRSIRGTVTGPSGLPLAGVLVRVTRLGSAVRGAPEVDRSDLPPPPLTLEEKLRRTIADHYAAGGEICSATTGADGCYAFEQLRDGRYEVVAWSAGMRFTSDGESNRQVRPDAVVDWSGRTMGRLPIEVQLPDGSSAPHARIAIRRRGSNEEVASQGWLAAQRSLVLEPGDWELRAILGHPESGPAWPDYLVSSWGKASLQAGVDPAPLSLTLASQSCVRGTVKLASGSKPKQAVVRGKRLEPGESADPERLRKNDGSGAATQNAWVSDGEFNFLDVPQGRWLLVVQRDWSSPVLAHALVDVGAGTTRQEFVIAELDRASCIEVTVLAPDGGRVPNASLQWHVARGINMDSDDCAVEARAPGVWWLPLESARGLGFEPLEPWPADARVYLAASTSEHGTTSAEVFSTTRTLELKFGPPATLEVRVPGYVDGEYKERVHVAINKSGQGAASIGQWAGGVPTAEEGLVRLGPVEAGTYRLSMWINGQRRRGWSQVEASSIELTLAPGENLATLPIPALYALSLRMPEGSDGGLQLEATTKSVNRGLWAQIDTSSVPPLATFDAVPAGDYRCVWSGGNKAGLMYLSVPNCGSLLDWSPQPVNALRVTIADGGGELVALGFAEGDLVTAIDGKQIESQVDLQVLWTLARAQRKLAITLLRDGNEMNLEVDGKRLMNHGKLGGQFEPATR